MDECVIKCGIEYGLFRLRSSFDEYAGQVVVPFRACFGTDGIKVLASLFGIKVLTGVRHAHERYTHLHLHLVAGLGIVVHPYADVIACEFLLVGFIEFVLAVVGIPLRLYARHRTLFLPVAGC